MNAHKMTAPKTQAECDHLNAMRDYEAAHKVWMNTSIFSPEGIAAKKALREADLIYTAAQERAATERRTRP